MIYRCTADNNEFDIEATSHEEAARKLAAGGGWFLTDADVPADGFVLEVEVECDDDYRSFDVIVPPGSPGMRTDGVDDAQ